MAGNNIKIHTHTQISVGECTPEWMWGCVSVCVIILQVFAFVCPCQVCAQHSQELFTKLFYGNFFSSFVFYLAFYLALNYVKCVMMHMKNAVQKDYLTCICRKLLLL